MENKLKSKKRLLGLIAIFLVPVILFGIIMFTKKSDSTNPSVPPNQNAFNDKLPAANLKGAEKNKLEIYLQAQQDSLKRKEQADQDPYSKNWFDPAPHPGEVMLEEPSVISHSKNTFSRNHPDANEKKINERIEKIMTAIHASNSEDQVTAPPQETSFMNEKGSDVERLEQMLQSLQTNDTASNPEMKQLEGLLDKILDIQHPERVKNGSTATPSEQKKDTSRFTILEEPETSHADGFPNSIENDQNAFFCLSSPVRAAGDAGASFLAVIHDNQKIQEGQSVKLRLLQNVFIGSTPIPKGHFLYGKCTISNGRVQVRIQEISYQNMVFPAQLIVYDQTDGMEGINVQGDLSEEITKNGVDQLIQQMQLNTLTTSIGAQAAASGIQTAKNLIGKKVKKITVTLKAGHSLILKPTQF